MVRRLQVFWISVAVVGAQHRITHVAGRHPDGSRWELSAEEAFNAMRNGIISLHIIRKGQIVDLSASYADSQYYLCASGDAQLLALPSFLPAQGFPG